MGLPEEQGLEEVSQQLPELRVLPEVGGVGRLQLLLWGVGREVMGTNVPRPQRLCQGCG